MTNWLLAEVSRSDHTAYMAGTARHNAFYYQFCLQMVAPVFNLCQRRLKPAAPKITL
jgi:hypothetical protein